MLCSECLCLPKFYVEDLTPKMMVLGGRAFGRLLEMGLGPLRKSLQKASSLPPPYEDTRNQRPERGPSPDHVAP